MSQTLPIIAAFVRTSLFEPAAFSPFGQPRTSKSLVKPFRRFMI
jgi:hypothetical protein